MSSTKSANGRCPSRPSRPTEQWNVKHWDGALATGLGRVCIENVDATTRKNCSMLVPLSSCVIRDQGTIRPARPFGKELGATKAQFLDGRPGVPIMALPRSVSMGSGIAISMAPFVHYLIANCRPLGVLQPKSTREPSKPGGRGTLECYCSNGALRWRDLPG